MRKIYLYLSAAVAICTTLSCSKENTNGIVVQSKVEFALLDENGNDLLDPDHTNHLDTKQIKVYYIEDQKEVLYYQWNLEASHGYLIHEPEMHITRYRACIMLNNFYEYTAGVYRTIVEWSPGQRDIIDAEYRKAEGSIFLTRLTVNGNPLKSYERSQEGNYYILIK